MRLFPFTLHFVLSNSVGDTNTKLDLLGSVCFLREMANKFPNRTDFERALNVVDKQA